MLLNSRMVLADDGQHVVYCSLSVRAQHSASAADDLNVPQAKQAQETASINENDNSVLQHMQTTCAGDKCPSATLCIADMQRGHDEPNTSVCARTRCKITER